MNYLKQPDELLYHLPFHLIYFTDGSHRYVPWRHINSNFLLVPSGCFIFCPISVSISSECWLPFWLTYGAINALGPNRMGCIYSITLPKKRVSVRYVQAEYLYYIYVKKVLVLKAIILKWQPGSFVSCTGNYYYAMEMMPSAALSLPIPSNCLWSHSLCTQLHCCWLMGAMLPALLNNTLLNLSGLGASIRESDLVGRLEYICSK